MYSFNKVFYGIFVGCVKSFLWNFDYWYFWWIYCEERVCCYFNEYYKFGKGIGIVEVVGNCFDFVCDWKGYVYNF